MLDPPVTADSSGPAGGPTESGGGVRSVDPIRAFTLVALTSVVAIVVLAVLGSWFDLGGSGTVAITTIGGIVVAVYSGLAFRSRS